MRSSLIGMCSAVALVAVASSAQAAVIASDNGSNYGSGWTNGSNGGFGFGAWSFNQNGGGYTGAFIGNPENIGVTGMGSSAFALYANGLSSTAQWSKAARSFSNPLGIGDSFSLQWGINWASGGSSGEKGFSLSCTGNPSSPDIMVKNIGESASIQVYSVATGYVDIGFGYGTNAMTWTFTQTTANTVTVTANDRDGSGLYTATFAVSGRLSGFELTTSYLYDNNSNREPYYNNFTINSVPAPGAAALVGLAGLLGSRRRRN